MKSAVKSPASAVRPRLLIVGSRSYIGAACYQALQGTFDIRLTNRDGSNGAAPLNLLQPDDFAYSSLGPRDTILFCAAISSPDVCGSNPAMARQVNVTGPTLFLRRALGQGARAIFLSSDTVVGPTAGFADETVVPKPHGHYASFKKELEDILLAESATKILRLSLVISLQDKFTAYLQQCLHEGKTPALLHPIYRNGVHVSDVVALVRNLTLDWDCHPARLIHVAGPRCLSRIGLAEQLFECIGYSGPYTVEKPAEAFYNQRPERIALQSLHLKKILGREPISIATGYRMELKNT